MSRIMTPPVSIEQFAAYLDGNLTSDEMARMSSLIDGNDMLKDLTEANLSIENTLSSYSAVDLQLPDDIMSMDFELPTLPTEASKTSPLVTLTPEWMDGSMVACAATDEFPALIDDNDSDLHLSTDDIDNGVSDIMDSFNEQDGSDLTPTDEL